MIQKAYTLVSRAPNLLRTPFPKRKLRTNPSLPSRLPLLNRPQDRIRNQREYAGEVNTNIATIGPEFLRNGSNVPSLAHTRDTAG